MAKIQRNIPGNSVRDPSMIDNLIYNEKSGARKSMQVGSVLLPLNDGAGGFTTDASTQRVLPGMGKNLAIFNKSATVDYSVTIGDSTVAAQAIGAVQAGTQFAGIACAHGVWTYVSCGYYNYVITNNNNLVVYLIDDDTDIKQEASR